MNLSGVLQWIGALAGLIAAIASVLEIFHVQHLRVEINSRLDERLKIAREAGFAEGIKAERERNGKVS
jgi:hypothetical protein